MMNGSNIALALALALAAGCGTTPGYKQADRTGEAINTLRSDIAKVKEAVDGSMKALDDLEASATTDPRKAFETYSKSVDKVASAAETAQKQAAAMREKGEQYFQQWETQLGTVKNEEIRKLASDHRAKLQESFNNIRVAAQDAKSNFPPFLSDLRDLRTALSADLTVQGIDNAKGIFKSTKGKGTELQKNLDVLVSELNSVVAAITAPKGK